MIECAEVAELVNDDVVEKLGAKMHKFVIKVDVALVRARSPTRAVVPYGNFSYPKTIELIEVEKPLLDELECAGFVFLEISLAAGKYSANAGMTRIYAHEPVSVATKELFYSG